MTRIPPSRRSPRCAAFLVAGSLALGVAACGGGGEAGSGLTGELAIDGSSTVFPFAQAAAEGFMGQNPGVRITVGQSGTGGGFEKFCAGETLIATASREIDEDEEEPLCERNGVAYEELQVASDGVAVVTSKQLGLECLTTEQLAQLWEQGSTIKSLNQIDPSLPSRPLSLFGPGTDSGTFEFFTEEVTGEEGNTRKDYQPSEDDNVLVQGISGEPGGLGYLGFSYFQTNKDKLAAVAVDDGEGCVAPTVKTIQSGQYEPLSRPLYMYPSQKALQDPAGKAFMEYALANHQQIAGAVQMVPMSQEDAEDSKEELAG